MVDFHDQESFTARLDKVVASGDPTAIAVYRAGLKAYPRFVWNPLQLARSSPAAVAF
jgi:hypothetical protein